MRKVGEATFTIDWDNHALVVQKGEQKFIVSQDDPLGSLSPGLAAAANHIRKHSLVQGVNSIDYVITWTATSRESEREAARTRLGLVPIEQAEEINRVNQEFRSARRVEWKFKLDEFSEAEIEVDWLKE